MSNRSEVFGRLVRGAINGIATYEGKAAPAIEEELAAQVGLAGSAVQRYKAGHLPPDPRTVRVIAEAGVRRGLLGRAWLERFLRAARYPEAAALLAELCPEPAAPRRAPRAYHNLPAPTYSQFIMRPEPFAELLDGLARRSPAVVVVGMGGSGKTSLAREAAGRCLAGAEPLFDAAVWVGDKDRPGATTLASALDAVARTLDYPGLAQLEPAERRREVDQLLRRQRVLVVVDNFETVADPALLPWLLDMPEPSKALVTTREYRRDFRRGGWPVELRGMGGAEALALIDERLRVLRMERLVADRAQLEPLVAATGGSPKAIELALGLVKYERRPLSGVVADLRAARGDLFEDLFARAWRLLDDGAARLLLALTLFPASAAEAAAGAAAGVGGPALGRALERLADLALVDVQQADVDSPPRYALHPLARAFAAARLRERPAEEAAARARWVAWYLGLAAGAQASWYDTRALAALDPEAENIAAAIAWAAESGDDRAVLAISATLGYYYYVRGWWGRQLELNAGRLAAARRLGDSVEEGYAQLNILRVLALQGRAAEAAGPAAAVEEALRSAARTPAQRCSFMHGLAAHALAEGRLARGRELLAQVIAECGAGEPFKLVRARSWMAESLLREGRAAEAEPLFRAALAESLAIGYHRSATHCLLKLAQIALGRGELAEAARLLDDGLARASGALDRRNLAALLRASAQLHAARGDAAASRAALAEAADLFERLGMRRELAEAAAALAELPPAQA